NGVTLATAIGFLFNLFVGQRGSKGAGGIVQRGAERIGIPIFNRGLSRIDRVGYRQIETTEARGGVLQGIVVTLVKTGAAGTRQVAHIAHLITEQVGRATGFLERAVKATHLHCTEVTLQADKGVAGSKAVGAVAAGGEVDFLLDLEESL